MVLEVDVSSEPVVSGPTTLSSTKEQRTFDFAAPQDEMVKPDNTIENGINSPRASLSENILLSSPFYNLPLSSEVFFRSVSGDSLPLNLEGDGSSSVGSSSLGNILLSIPSYNLSGSGIFFSSVSGDLLPLNLEFNASSEQVVSGSTTLSPYLALDSIPDISELPILSIEVNASSEPVVSGPITLSSPHTFDFNIPENPVKSLPPFAGIEGKGKPIEGLEKYENMIKLIAELPKELQFECLQKFSLLKYADYDAVKVLHKLITENEDFFKDAPASLYDNLDPVTMAYLHKSGKFGFNREKFLGKTIKELSATPVTKSLLKYAYSTRVTDPETIMPSVTKLVDRLEIVLKYDGTNLIKTILTIATDLNPIIFKFDQADPLSGYTTVDGISITIKAIPLTRYESTESHNLDTLVHEYTHHVVGFLFDDKFDHKPYFLENPISKSQKDLEKAAEEDVSIQGHSDYNYIKKYYAREMIAYYVGETAGKIHQKQTKGTDTGFSVTQSKAFISWFQTHFLPVLNVYSKSGKAGLSETLKCMFGSDKESTHMSISELSHLILDYLDFSDVESAGDIKLLLEDMFGSIKESTHTYISESSDLVLDYLGFSHVEPVGDITLVEG